MRYTWASTTSDVGSSGGGSSRATAASLVRQASVSTSTLRKAKGKGGIVGASQGVENPGARMSSTVRRSRPPRRRSFPLMALPLKNSTAKFLHLFEAARMRRTIERVENLDGAHAHYARRLVLDRSSETDIHEDVQRLFASIGARALRHFDDGILPVAPPYLEALTFDVEHKNAFRAKHAQIDLVATMLGRRRRAGHRSGRAIDELHDGSIVIVDAGRRL